MSTEHWAEIFFFLFGISIEFKNWYPIIRYFLEAQNTDSTKQEVTSHAFTTQNCNFNFLQNLNRQSLTEAIWSRNLLNDPEEIAGTPVHEMPENDMLVRHDICKAKDPCFLSIWNMI